MKSSAEGVLRLAALDDYLGSGEGRFFGSGYRRTRQRLRNSTVESTPDGHVLVGTAAVGYPTDWSAKSGKAQLPHLTTIDVLLLASQAVETLLDRSGRLDRVQQPRAWLRQAHIRAGRSPVEEDFDAVPVRARLLESDLSSRSAAISTSTVEASIGALRVRTELAHTDPDALQTPGVDRSYTPPYGDGYRTRVPRVDDISVDIATSRAQALATVEVPASPPGADVPPGSRLESAYQPSVSFVDTFVLALQLGQVLLYETDDLDRDRSNTLWMRQTTWHADSARRPTSSPVAFSVGLQDSRILRTSAGRWRCADIVADHEHVTLRCSVAHLLPLPPTGGMC